MTTSTDVRFKVRENLLRRVASRQGFTLHRSRRRDPRAIDYGLYWLVDDDGDLVSGELMLTIDEVEEFLG